MKKYSEQEMATLIRDIETQFSAFLTKAEESSLNKSEVVQPVHQSLVVCMSGKSVYRFYF